MMVRALKIVLIPQLMLAVALVVGPSQVSLAQGDADLD
jgi:hypothetical protein